MIMLGDGEGWLAANCSRGIFVADVASSGSLETGKEKTGLPKENSGEQIWK